MTRVAKDMNQDVPHFPDDSKVASQLLQLVTKANPAQYMKNVRTFFSQNQFFVRASHDFKKSSETVKKIV